MSRTSRSDVRRHRGFTLMEAMVSLTMLIIVMVVAMTLLFTLRSFAERQQYYTAPRQTSRRAIDYVSDMVSQATDLNATQGNPNAIPTQIRYGSKNDTIPTNVTYDNLGTGGPTGGLEEVNGVVFNTMLVSNKYTAYGDYGTDLLTIQVPVFFKAIPIAKWTGNAFAAATMYIDFEDGCPDDDLNMQLFKDAVGWDGTSSRLLSYTDGNGNTFLYMITNMPPNGSNCDASPTFWSGKGKSPACTPKDPLDPCDVIHVVANPGGSDHINPPGGFRPPQTRPLNLFASQEFIALRVRTPLDTACNPTGPPQLEQKRGLFIPSADATACGDTPAYFTPLIENIEDLQVSWIYAKDPTSGAINVYDSATNEIPNTLKNPDLYDETSNGHATIPTAGVPPQIGLYSTDDTTTLCVDATGERFPTDPYNVLNSANSTDRSYACRWDIRYVRGLRVTLTGRSPALNMGAKGMAQRGKMLTQAFVPAFNYRPTAENHPLTATSPDDFDHYKMVSTIMVRNRMLGY